MVVVVVGFSCANLNGRGLNIFAVYRHVLHGNCTCWAIASMYVYSEVNLSIHWGVNCACLTPG